MGRAATRTVSLTTGAARFPLEASWNAPYPAASASARPRPMRSSRRRRPVSLNSISMHWTVRIGAWRHHHPAGRSEGYEVARRTTVLYSQGNALVSWLETGQNRLFRRRGALGSAAARGL